MEMFCCTEATFSTRIMWPEKDTFGDDEFI